MVQKEPSISELRAALKAADLPPKEDLERMIRHGIINRQGRVTRLFGTAGMEPEPEALEYLEQQKKLAKKKNGKRHGNGAKPRSAE